MNRYKTQDRPDPKWIARGRKGNYFARVQMSFMGRDALGAVLDAKKPGRVLLPAYTCDEVINEFRKRSVEISWYDINPDFTIDAEMICKLIKQDQIDLFYYIIYFGLEGLNRDLNRTVKEQFPDVFLVEDRAHYLSGDFNFEHCDAYTFSFRKLLPIPEGGGFICRRPIELHYSRHIRANILPFLMHIKKRVLSYNDNFNRSALTGSKPVNYIMPISRLSRNMVERYDYEDEATFRSSCFLDWVSGLKAANLQPLFTELGDADIPQGCPIVVDDALAVQQFMKGRGYYLRRHWRLDEEAGKAANTSLEISGKIITLPIYRGITKLIQERVIQHLKDY